MSSARSYAFLRNAVFNALRRQKVQFAQKQGTICQWVAVIPGRRVLNSMLALPFVPTAYCFWGSKKEQVPDKATLEKLFLKKCDELYRENKIEELYQLLYDRRDSTSADVMWRLARVACERGKIAGKEPTRKNCIYEAFEYINQAMVMDNLNFAVHKWYAILLDYTGEYEGTKQRISNAFKVKEHFLKAIALNPKDSTSVYSLGFWCYLFADLPWYQRKIAALIFASPPESSYEEALKYFKMAEEMEPNFYSMNTLMLGKTYLRLNDKENAIKYLRKVKEFPVKTPDDKQALAEATELLQQMGKNN